MFSNLKSKKRMTRLLIGVLVMALTVTGSALLIGDFLPKAEAETATVNTSGDWNGIFRDENTPAAGTSYVITLGSDINLSNKLNAIPAGVTVELKMNDKTIQWYNVANDTNAIMSKSYPASDNFWGILENNGTLNITGSGTISQYQINRNFDNTDKQDNYIVKGAAIVNNGTLTIGNLVTVENFMGMHTDGGDSYQDLHVYSHAIYNTGTVTSSGTIQSGAFSQGTTGGSTNSWSCAFAYGIFGGNVNVNGGKIFAEADSGFHHDGNSRGNKVDNIAVGVYSNNAKILGNTSITTEAISWRDSNDSGTNIWRDGGKNMSWGIGVMYSKENYPVIGAAVSINASFRMVNNRETVNFPKLNKKTAVISQGGCGGSDGPEDYGRRAYAIAGIDANLNTWMYGGQGEEKAVHDGGTDIFYGVNQDGYPARTGYYAEMSYRTGNKVVVDSTNNFEQSGGNSHEIKTSYITSGASGNNVNGQYVVIYRYYDTANRLISASYTPNTAIHSKMNFTNTSGVFTGNEVLKKSSGGDVTNSNYYQFIDVYMKSVDAANFAAVDVNNLDSPVKTKGDAFDPSVGKTLNGGSSVLVYVDYKELAATNVKVAVGPSSQEISKYSNTKTFKIEYTGQAIRPNIDFNIGIIDISTDTDISLSGREEYKLVSEYYELSGADSQTKLDVIYSYSLDGSTWTEGLPTNAGTYKLRIVLPDDTNIARAGSGNRHGGTFDVECTITQATPSISGDSAQRGTYGNNIATLINTNLYSVTGVPNESLDMTGKWSYTGFNSTDYPEVGNKTVTLKWTPTGNCATNYKNTSFTVTLTVSPNSATVYPSDISVMYGGEPEYRLSYAGLPECDSGKTDGWLKYTSFLVEYNGVWQAYNKTMVPGQYNIKIDSFGGSSDANNTFDSTSTYGKITIEKAPLYYTATATERTYVPGNTNVEVQLTYAGGAINNDAFDQHLTAQGTVTTADAGENKDVTVTTDGIGIMSPTKYFVAISNEPKVTINKAKPDAIYSVGSYDSVYDAGRTLASILITNDNAQVQGVWTWVNADTVPSVDVTTYKAKFTPNYSNNYESIETDIELTITKKPVTVRVEEKHVSYGDPLPKLDLTYDGFTGTDSITTIRTTGSIAATTAYEVGSAAGNEYSINITMIDYEAVNYTFIPENTKIVVNKKTVTMTLPSKTIVYGDPAPEFSALDLQYDAEAFVNTDTIGNIGVSFNIGTTYSQGDDVGTYDVTATNDAAHNYEFVYVNGVITVKKAELSVVADDVSIVYNESAPSVFSYKLQGYKFDKDISEISGKPVITTTYKSGDPVNTYPINISVSAMTSHNYNLTGVQGNLHVGKATPTSTYTQATALVYNGDAYSTANYLDVPQFIDSITSREVRGSIVLSDPSGIADYAATASDHSVTLSGTFVPSDSESYKSVSVSVLMLIDPKVVSGAPIIRGSAMEGATFTADISTMNPNSNSAYSYQWYRVTNNTAVAISGAISNTYTLTKADIGSEIYVAVTGIEANGFEGTQKSANSATIVEAFAKTVTAEQLDINGLGTFEYSAAGRKATVTKKSEYANLVGDITVYYNGKTSIPWYVGTYDVTVDVSAPYVPAGTSTEDRNNYYGPVSGLEIGTIEITPMSIMVGVAAADRIYDGTTRIADDMYNPIFMTMPSPDDDVNIDISNISVKFASAAAGSRKIITTGIELTGTDAYNYVIDLQDTYATIEKAELTATAIGVNRAYNGSTSVDVVFSNISGYASIDSSATVYAATATATAASANAGEQLISNIQYTLGGSSAGNYYITVTNDTTAKVTIQKAVPTVTPPVINDLVYNKNRRLADIVLSNYYISDGNGYWKFDDSLTVPTVNHKSYAATFVSQNSNYSDLKTNIEVNIQPKEVTLTAENISITYGEMPSFVITPDGFTGSDSLANMGGTQPFAVCGYIRGDDVGSYDITINHNLDSNGNYVFTIKEGKLTVNKANLYVSAEARSKDYDGTRDVDIDFAVISGRYSDDTATQVNISSQTGKGIASTENAGTRTVVYTAPELIGSKAGNYNIVVSPSSGVLTVVINKINPLGVQFPVSAQIEFGYDLTHAQFIGETEGDGVFAFENAHSTIPAYVGEHFGTYFCEFTPTDNVNYNVVKQYVNLTVTECVVNYVVGISGTLQVGERLSVSITGLPTKAYDYIRYQWYRVSDGQTFAISGADSSIYTPIEDDAGYTLVCMTYFDEGSPFIFNEDVGEFFGAYFGIYGQSSTTIEEENLTFWQRIIRWIEKLIEALTGIMWTMGG